MMIAWNFQLWRWNTHERQDSRIEESEPKKLFTNMPVIYVTAVNVKDKAGRLEFSTVQMLSILNSSNGSLGDKLCFPECAQNR